MGDPWDDTPPPPPPPLPYGEVRVTSPTGGQKGKKPERFDLIPVEPLREVARLYGRGAEKYDDRNWEKGYDWSLSFAAMQRHAWSFWDGESIDPETQRHHLASVIFHAMAMMEYEHRGSGTDDRPKAKPSRGLAGCVACADDPLDPALHNAIDGLISDFGVRR